jgi:hypothetical protein
MSKIDSPEVRLQRWLNQRGLRGNPFAAWNAEREPNLSDYFVDVGQFDELLRATDPCVVLARRGCGKTAQRQMLAAQCRPLQPDSTQLAVNYTVSGFERVLSQANEDVNQVRSIYHVNALLSLGLTALMEDILPHLAGQTAPFAGAQDRARLAAYVTHFAPHLMPATLTESPAVLDVADSGALLRGLAGLVQVAGLENCVVLMDGLDEIPLIAGDAAKTVAFLSSLLGMLNLLECPGMAFKFFLPQELEATLRAQRWFRPDRLRLFPIHWDAKGLLELIKQRLAYFSQRRPPYKELAQLCEDELAEVINQELVNLSEGLPRVALILANMLLQRHCQRPNPSELIALKTWEQVKAAWTVRRSDFVGKETTETPVSADVPVLQVEESGNVRLGESDITSEINPKEYRVLACLYQHRNGICTKETLIQEAWTGDQREGVSDQAIAASVARLRGTLRKLAPNAEYIETFKSIGYRLHPKGSKSENVEG